MSQLLLNNIMQALSGPQANSDGNIGPIRLGKNGDLISSNLHGRFYEQTYRGNVYSLGISNTAATSLNAIATGLTATATPYVGVYNPPTSTVNLVILKAMIVPTTIANSAVSPGGFMWCGAAGQTVLRDSFRTTRRRSRRPALRVRPSP